MVIYLDHNTIEASKLTARPRKGRTVSGYGSKLPTARMIKLTNGCWYRVYAICYSNCSSFYITIGNGFGKRFIDGYCEDAILERAI